MCAHAVKEHQQCEACGILAGEGHLVLELVRYREKMLCLGCVRRWEGLEKMLCPGCVKRWKGLEKKEGHPLTIEEMVMDDGARVRAKNPPHGSVR